LIENHWTVEFCNLSYQCPRLCGEAFVGWQNGIKWNVENSPKLQKKIVERIKD